MKIKYICFLTIYYINYQYEKCNAGKVKMHYLNPERPVITYYNPTYINNLTVNCRRITRSDPRHYIALFLDTRDVADNRITMDLYFYEFVQLNKYRPTFLTMHVKLCNLMEKDPLFSPSIMKAMKGKTCPYPPGQYNLTTVSFSRVPEGFPFSRGRIYINVSMNANEKITSLARGYGDLEMKTITRDI